jgi:tellurite resistance protein
MRRYIAYSLLAALCAGCASRAVVKGALSSEERQEYVEQTGALIPQRLKEDFVAGKAAEGMTKEMVVFLYGQPDRTENNRYG